MPSEQTLYNTQQGAYTQILILSSLTTPITATAVSAAQLLNIPDYSGEPTPAQPYQFAVQFEASLGGGVEGATAYLMTSFDGGTTWMPCAQSETIVSGQGSFNVYAVQGMGPLIGVAWVLDGTPAPTVSGKAWLIGTQAFTAQALSSVTVSTTYATPASSSTTATEAWVTARLQELTWKDPVRVATTTTLAAYTRTDNVITANANGALAAIDGVTLVAGDRLLLKNGAAAADNGIYTVTQVGTAGTPFILTRATDADSSAKVVSEIATLVEEGTTNIGMIFRLTTANPIVLNTTALSFSGELRAEAPTNQTGVVNLATLQTGVWKQPVRAATQTALPAYTRTDNVITANANGALPAIDGVTLSAGDRLLLANGAANNDNGIYTVTQVGTAGTPFILTRATDMDTDAKVRTSVKVPVDSGTIATGFVYTLTTLGAITLNTTGLTFAPQIQAAAPAGDFDLVNRETFQARSSKQPVRVATAAALAAYTRTGNVITANANGALAAIDGVTLVAGERLLLKNGAAGADNGIYTVTQVGTAGTPFVLTRASDMAADSDCVCGETVPVAEGTLFANAIFMQVTADPITLNTTALSFLKVAGVFPVERESAIAVTVNDDDELILIDATAGNVVVNLPAIGTRRRRPLTVANIAGANNAVITPNGADTVMGGATRNVGARASQTIMGPRAGTDWVNVG